MEDLDVEFKEQDVAVLDDVFLTFRTEQALFFYGLFAAESEKVVAAVAIGLDEAALKIGVDDTGCAWGLGAAHDGPGADLLHAGRKVGDQVQQPVTGVDEPVETGFGEAEVGEELAALVGFEQGDFGLERAADAHDLGTFFGGASLYLCGMGVAGHQRALIDIGDIEHGFCGDEVQVTGGQQLVFREVDGAGGLAGAECILELGDGTGFGLELGVGGVFRELFEAGGALFYRVQIGE